MLSRLSIFWRSALGYLTIIVLVVGVNLYVLNQLRVLTDSGAELVIHHFPAVETAKRLIASLYAQLKSDKQYLVLRDTLLLQEFLEEAENFRKTLQVLQEQEDSPNTQDLLMKTKQLHEELHTLFLSEGVEQTNRSEVSISSYESRRDTLVDTITETINSYITLQESSIGGILRDTHVRSVQAVDISRQLMIMALLLGLGLAGVASYSILRPLRRVQGQIRRIGQGQFGKTIPVTVPHELQELVRTVNWMSEQLQQLDQMKSEFLANVSHELRTPLTSIREGTQLLVDGIPGPINRDQRETLTILMESSQRLNQLIGNLLDLSRMEADMLSYHFRPTDLNRLVLRSVEKMKFLAERKHIQLLTELSHDRVRMQEVDGPRIEQVIENLLSNAIKFSSEGVSIAIQSKAAEDERSFHLLVADTGPGVPAEDLPHIFERFYQGRSQEGRSYVGSGIGLALSKRVVEAHGGKIWAESEVGKGTTFHVILGSVKSSGVAR